MKTLELQIEIVDQTRPVEQTSNRVMEYGIWNKSNKSQWYD